jgi:hypothetical protein
VESPPLRLSEDIDAPLSKPLANIEHALEQRMKVQLARQSRAAAEANVSPDRRRSAARAASRANMSKPAELRAG